MAIKSAGRRYTIPLIVNYTPVISNFAHYATACCIPIMPVENI